MRFSRKRTMSMSNTIVVAAFDGELGNGKWITASALTTFQLVQFYFPCDPYYFVHVIGIVKKVSSK